MPATHPTHSELLKFAAGTLSQSARKQLYVHLEKCEQCRAIVKNVNERPLSAATPRGSGSKKKVEQTRTSQENPTRQVTDLLIGATLGEYRVVERLGQGGMGVLYRAVQPLIGKEVAIKVVQSDIASDSTVVQRMIEEARAVNAARHQNIVDIFAFGQLPDGRPYMVMELLQGESLADLLSSVVRLPWRKALEVLDQCFAGLEAAHEQGVIHRDLKPENIFIDQKPQPWKVTLLDFGLATRTGHRDVKLTQQGTVVGTPGFMAPEQVQGMVDISPQTDVYAMGVVAWNMLTGREPFAGGSIVEVMHRHLTTAAPPIRPEVPEVPEAVEALVLQMMAKAQDQRPPDGEVRRRIAGLLGQGAAAPRPAPSRRLAVVGVAGAAAAGLALATWYGLSREESAPPALPSPIAATRPPAQPDSGSAIATALPVSTAADLRDAGAAIAEPAPAIEPRLAHDEMVWPCKRLQRISKIYKSALGDWMVVQLSFESDPPLVLVSVSDHAKKGTVEVKQALKPIAACKGGPKFIRAEKITSNSIWGTLNGPFFHGGVRTAATNVRVVKSRTGD